MQAEATSRPLALLGPQRVDPCLVQVIAELGLSERPLATVTAGWEEREREDQDLDREVGGGTRNLGLFPRAEEVFRADQELRSNMYARYDRMSEHAALYQAQLGPLLETMRQLIERVRGGQGHLAPDLEHTASLARGLDARRLEVTDALDEEVFGPATWEREHVARHREELRSELDGAGALLIAGGHVGILLNRLRLFGVLDLVPPELPIVAWAGGAMVVSERVVLFHDSPPQGPGDAQIHVRGLGLARGAVVLPDPARRLHVEDSARVELLVRRFGATPCIALGDGAWLAGASDMPVPAWSQGRGALSLSLEEAQA